MIRSAAEGAFWNLVSAARADREISAAEQKVLNAHVVKLGLSADRAREIQTEATAESPPKIKMPGTDRERHEMFRSVVEVAAADGAIAPGELVVIRNLAGRLSIPIQSLDGLISSALKRSGRKLDAAFAVLPAAGVAGGPSSEDLPRPVPEADGALEFLRSMPFAARLAPSVRRCRNCSLPFANQDAYAKVCRPCRVDLGVNALTSGHLETLHGLLFVLMMIPVGLLVEEATGLWSWGWNYRSGLRHRKGDGIAIFPALAITAALAWMAAWGIELIIMACLGRRREKTSD